MSHLIPNEPTEPIPEELYAELEPRDTYFEDYAYDTLAEMGLTEDEIKVLLEGK